MAQTHAGRARSRPGSHGPARRRPWSRRSRSRTTPDGAASADTLIGQVNAELARAAAAIYSLNG